MSETTPPHLIDEGILLRAPSQNPREEAPILAPTVQAPPAEPPPHRRAQEPQEPLLDEQEMEVARLFEDGEAQHERGMQESMDRELVRMFRTFSDLDPDLAAEAKAKGLDLGINSRLAEQDMGKVRSLWEEHKLRVKLRAGGNDWLYRSMMNPEFLKIARDDVDNLGVIAKTVNHFTARSLATESSLLSAKRLRQGGYLSPDDEAELDRIERERATLPMDSSGEGFIGGIWYGGAGMVGGMWKTALWSAGAAAVAGGSMSAAGPAAPVAAPTAALWAGAVTMGMLSGEQMAGEAYAEMRRLGITHDSAKGRAYAMGIAGGMLEAGALGFGGGLVAKQAFKEYMAGRVSREALTVMTRSQALKKAAAGYVHSAGAEVATELSQELIQYGLVGSALSADGKIDDRDGPQLSKVFMETVRGVAILSAFGPALSLRNNTRRAAEAVHQGKQIEKLGDGVKASKVGSRDQDAMMQFLNQAMSESNGPRTVIFDLDTFTERMAEAGITMSDLQRGSPEVAEALRKAEAQGLGDFEVPTAAYGAKFLTTDFGNSMIPHARIEADGMTAEEGVLHQDSIEEIRKRGADLLADEEVATKDFVAGVAEARSQMHAKLVEAGVGPREAQVEANLYSHMVAVMSDRLGITPQEFQAKHGLDVSRDNGQTEGPALEQGARGRYYPGARRVVLTDSANPSTVMHEMQHHFAGVMQQIASQPDAPVEILADVDTMTRFWGIEGDTPEARLAKWNAMSFEEQAPHQESLAYNFELWLFTGTAVTSGLRRLFQRIRTFMVGVYSSLVEAQRKLSGTYESQFGAELPGMTPELQEMFERMVAGEQVARRAIAMRELGPMFTTVEDFVAAGNSEERWNSYQAEMEDLTQQLIDDLSGESLRAMQWQNRAQGRVLAAMKREHQAKRKKVRAEIAEMVENEPLYQIIKMLKDEKNGLDRETVRQMLDGIDEQAKADTLRKLGRKVRKGGYNPDDVAALFDDTYPTGRDLVSAMVAARPLKDEIDARTDEEMQKRYGEPMSDEEVQHRIEAAVHSDARSRFVAAELKFLDKTTAPVPLMVAAAQEQARRILAGRALNDMSAHRFAQMETRAARAARDAMKPVSPRKASEDGKRAAVEGRGPDYRAAIKAKRRQLLYGQLAKMAVEAKDEVGKGLAFFRKVGRGKEKDLAGKRDVNLVMVARSILAQYGLLSTGQTVRTADFLDRMKAYAPDLLERYEETLAQAFDAGQEVGFDYRKMTLEDFEVLRELIESLWHRADQEHKVMIEGRQMLVADIVAELRGAGLDARAKPDIDGRNSATSTKALDKARLKLDRTRAVLTKVEHYMHSLDGGKQGPFTKYLYREIKESVNAYRHAATVHTKEFVDLVKGLQDRGLLPAGAIEATELGTDDNGQPVYTFGGKTSNVGGMSELLGAMLHTGNESNRSKFLVAGRGGGAPSWADIDAEGSIDYSRWDAFVERLVRDGVLRKEHFDFLQSVWDLMEKVKPQLQKAHMELEGYYFKEVPADPFSVTFPDGSVVDYKGGYVPASVDYDRGRRVAQLGPVDMTEDQLRGEFFEGLPKVGSGMTKERTNVKKRPLSMSLDHIIGHIDKSLRYAYVAPAAANMGRILKNEEFRAAAVAMDPQLIDGILVPFLERAVTQSLYVPGDSVVGDIFKYLRRIVGVKVMSGNVVNTLQQYTGISNASLYVEPRYLKGGLALLLKERSRLSDDVASKSTYMDDRMRSQMFELTDEMRGVTLTQSTGEKVQRKAIRWGYVLQSTAQNMVDVVVWKGAYDQALDATTAEESLFDAERRAVREADAAVRLSQGSFSPEDVAAYEKGTPAGRAWTQFTSYFNTVLNQVAFAKKDQKLKTYLVAFAAPMIVAEAIAMTFYDKWDDEDDDGHIDGMVFADLLVGSQLRGLAPMVPAFGPAAASIFEAAFTDKPYGDRTAAAPATVATTRHLTGLAMAIKAAIDGEEFKSRHARDVLSMLVLGFPYGGAALAPAIRPLNYGLGQALGEHEPTGFLDGVRGYITGYAGKDSKK